ncbi:MAG: hypothetical protein ABI151_11180 [Chitinophagaceae bacterium]
MTKKQNFKLIHGTFAPSEAAQILFTLISSKINFHTMESFSSRDRYGKDVPQSEKRIQALKKIQVSLKKFLDLAEKKGTLLQIEGSVDITMID